MDKLVLENLCKIVVPLFGAALAAPNKCCTKLRCKFYFDLDLYQQRYFLQKIEEFKNFSGPLRDFPLTRHI